MSGSALYCTLLTNRLLARFGIGEFRLAPGYAAHSNHVCGKCHYGNVLQITVRTGRAAYNWLSDAGKLGERPKSEHDNGNSHRLIKGGATFWSRLS